MEQYLCMDIGGTRIKYGMADAEGRLLYVRETDTKAYLGGEALMERVFGLIRTELESCRQAAGICISTAGMVDCRQGKIVYASELIPGYTGMPIKARLEEQFGLPCQVENDVNCAGLAESLAGAGRGSSVCLCLTVGTGIGGALIIDGKVFHGFCGSAGEVGYMCLGASDAGRADGRAGGQRPEEAWEAPGPSFQDLGSASALVRTVQEQKGMRPGSIDGRWVFAQAEQGDADCIRAIEGMADVLGRGIANLCYMCNPETVVLGGGIMEQREYLYPRIREQMNGYLLPFIAARTRLAMAQLGNRAGMLGAFYHFRGCQTEQRQKDG